MLKITKNEYLNEDLIEAVCLYKCCPIKRFASEAGKKNMQRRFVGKYGIKSLFILKDGFVVMAPYTPETYMSRMDDSVYLQSDRKKYYFKTSMIREICTKLSAGQKREVIKAREAGTYIMLSGNKKTKYYIFTTTGRIYGVQQILLSE